MSSIAISYGDLGRSSGEAKDVARELGDYSDFLYKKVYKKLDDYDGNHNERIQTAKSRTYNKIQRLNDQQSRYENYAEQLKELKETCKDVDKTVKNRVSELTAQFKDRYDINNGRIRNGINFLITAGKNKTWLGREAGDAVNRLEHGRDMLKSNIKKWYHYEGGKELLHSLGEYALNFAIAALGVLAAVATIISGGTFLAILGAIAAIGLGVMGMINATTALYNDCEAFIIATVDPATAKRRGKLDKWSDWQRSSFIYGDRGENYEYDKTRNFMADAYDFTETALTVVSFVCSVGKICENGVKMHKNGTKTIWDEFKSAAKTKNKGWFMDWGKGFAKDMGKNLKNEFLNADGKTTWESIKNVASSEKNIISVGRDLVKGDFLSGVGGVVLPAVTFGSFLKEGEIENVTFSDLYDPVDKGISGGGKISDFCHLDDTFIDLDLSELTNKISDLKIDVSVPDVQIPDFMNLDVRTGNPVLVM